MIVRFPWLIPLLSTLAISLSVDCQAARASDAASGQETKDAQQADPQPSLTPAEIVATGREVPQLAAFDKLMRRFMAEHQVPGGSLAIFHQGHLVYARGFGLADVESGEPVRPDSLFRIASISKPITAVGLLQLVEQGKLDLDARVFDVLDIEPHISRRRKPDPRVREITVLQCLQHTGGWDRAKSFDPMFEPVRIARVLRVESPPGPRDIIRYIQSRPLDFAPGERYAYANIDYCILGRIIEKLSGQSYEEYTQQQVLDPIGISSMRLGRTLPEHRADGEVKYYNGDKTEPAVFAQLDRKQVPLQYGAFHLEAMDSHGGWLSNAADVARFGAAFDDPKNSPLVKPETVELMWARPAGRAGCDDNGRPAERFYGCGWFVRPHGDGGGNAVHSGALEGTSTLLIHRNDGINMAVLFNSRYTKDRNELIMPLMPLLHETANDISHWPSASVSLDP